MQVIKSRPLFIFIVIICILLHPRKYGIKKKLPVHLEGEAVQSRNHSSVTIKFKFIKKLKRLPFCNRLTDFVQIFFVGCYF